MHGKDSVFTEALLAVAHEREHDHCYRVGWSGNRAHIVPAPALPLTFVTVKRNQPIQLLDHPENHVYLGCNSAKSPVEPPIIESSRSEKRGSTGVL